MSALLRWLHCIIHGCASYSPRKSLDFHSTYAAFTFFISITPSFHIVSKNFLETELEDFNEKKSFPFKQHITLATFIGSIFTPAAWYASGTELLCPKTDRGTQLVNPDNKRATNWYEN
jgi:hypothetical protein